MAREGLKVLTFAYKDIQMSELEELLQMEGGDESIEFRKAIEKDFIYLVTFGLEDPFRNDIVDHINEFKYENTLRSDGKASSLSMNLRLISGDHIETVKFVALHLGLISDEEANDGDKVMHSDDFRKLIGEYYKIWNE